MTRRLPPAPNWAEYAAYIWANSDARLPKQISHIVGHQGISAAINSFLLNVYPDKAVFDSWGRPRFSWDVNKRELARQYFADKPPVMPPRPKIETSPRNLRIYESYRLHGNRQGEIAKAHHLSSSRIKQIVDAVELKIKRNRLSLYPRAHLGRVQDPDPCQRDVWLIFTVPADPHFDAMEPVR